MSEDPCEPPNLSTRQQLLLKFCPPPADFDQFSALLRWLNSGNAVPVDTMAMVSGALQICRLQARDIMVPRSQMEVIPYQSSLRQITELIVESGHSRFPVIGEDRDDVQGILIAKDILRYCYNENLATSFSIRDVLRKPVFIPESKRLNILLQAFRSSRNHMAIVVDEYGGIAGLVTIEDVIEEIVGEIDDEHDAEDEETQYKPLGDQLFSVHGQMPIEDFNQVFHTQFSDETYDTIGGLVIQAFGHVPKRRNSIVIQGITFTVAWVKKGQVRALRVKLPKLDGPLALPPPEFFPQRDDS